MPKTCFARSRNPTVAKTLHLRPQYRAEIERLLRKHLPGVEAWAYGSRVTGLSHDGSDLDMVLRTSDLQAIPVDRLDAFLQALRESPIPILVEARDWARLPEKFHDEVRRSHVVLASAAQESETAGVFGTTTASE